MDSKAEDKLLSAGHDGAATSRTGVHSIHGSRCRKGKAGEKQCSQCYAQPCGGEFCPGLLCLYGEVMTSTPHAASEATIDVRGCNTTIYHLGCGQVQLSALFYCLDYVTKSTGEHESCLSYAAAARRHVRDFTSTAEDSGRVCCVFFVRLVPMRTVVRTPELAPFGTARS